MKNWKKLQLMGERVFLRPLRKTDFLRVFELINDPNVTFFLYSVEAPVKIKEEKAFVKRAEKNWKEQKEFTFAICEEKNRELVGCCGLEHYDKTNRSAEFGIWIGKQYWGNGFGFEAAFLAFKFGFERLKLHRIKYRHNVKNKRSKGLATAIGTRYEGKERDVVYKRGKFYDGSVRSMLASEWKKKHEKKKSQVRK